MKNLTLVLWLNRLAAKAAKRAEIIAAAFVIGIVFMLVLPLTPTLLDILIAISLGVSGLVVVVSMYMSGPVSFSTFPAVLLLTTLFRLAISVASTRLILLDAHAGNIVQTFGNFVVGGNLVVGLVVFLILTVVQFIVITKGSERVSEVAARFSLDAMPGKQMSIDSDLRSNILTPEEAKAKRALLSQESQLHGAMDGAMKFVKGDAIASICIVVINLVGGIAIGVLQRDMDMSAAGRVYSVLSIGDALVAQIPALLISLAAGIITTRVAGDNKKDDERARNVGEDIAAQLFGEPKALLTASAIMLLFAMVPGMPVSVFFTLTLLLGIGGAIGMLKPMADAALKRQAEDLERKNAAIVDLTNFAATKPFILRLAASMINSDESRKIHNALRVMRNSMLEHRGIPDLKPIEIEFHPSAPVGRAQFMMSEVPLVDDEIRLGWGATIESLERLIELGFTAIEAPLAGTRRFRVWVRLDDEQKLKDAGVQFQPWETVFCADVEAEMLRNCQMFVGVNEVIRFTRWAERRYPELGKEVNKTVTLPRLAEVIQRLVREGISLRNARLLLETVLDWAPKERDPDIIADYVRLSFKRQLCYEVAREGLIEVILLSPELEDQLRNAMRQTSQGSYLDLDSEVEQAILDKLNELTSNVATPIAPPVLVTAADIRRSVRKLIEEEFFSVPVFAFSELTQHSKVQPVGMIEV